MNKAPSSPRTSAKHPSLAADMVKRAPITVLVVGQVPPPVNGQSLMIQAFLQGEYEGLRLVHVPMLFSRSTAEIGSFNIRKLLVLIVTLSQILYTRFTSGATVLYYPPAGANLTPVLRDLFLLIPTRIFFRRTVFHFHAAGLFGIYARLPKLLRFLFRIAYDNPDLAIFTTAATSVEATRLNAKSLAIIPCGVEDKTDAIPLKESETSASMPLILFAGILCEEKGILILLEACRQLMRARVVFELVCIGAFQTPELESRVKTILKETGLDKMVQFPGVVTGSKKDNLFAKADVFCFPSFYPAESFGVVLIEAMSFSLPIVATDWQGIPEVVGRPTGAIDSPGALLVAPKDSEGLAHALSVLLLSPTLRESMGQLNRARYLECFTLAKYRHNLEQALLALTTGQTSGTSPITSDPPGTSKRRSVENQESVSA